MSTEDKFKELITKMNATPFLFIGSGLSRRYIDLPDWKGLLKKFSSNTRPFEYFLSKSEGNIPKAAKLLSKEYHKYWWTQNKSTKPTKETSDAMASISGPLKIDIANYLKGIDTEPSIASNRSEISDLKKANIGGIITTNWDMLLEHLFPDYTTYIGQDELILKNPQWIAEIYKIHGCASKPQSLVLTSNDYRIFNKKSKYLASKLMTIFMEHPIIFLGYSMSDPNITSILQSLSSCLNTEQISRLKNNLIFVNRPKPKEECGIHETLVYACNTPIPAIKIVTDNYSDVYRPLGSIKQRIPTKLLRRFREQLYALTTTLIPSEKLKVIEIEKLTEHDEIEFVVGIGLQVQNKNIIAPRGYSSLGYDDLAEDILHDNKNLDPNEILTHTIPELATKSKYVPVFKYLKKCGISSKKGYETSAYKNEKISKIINTNLKEFRSKYYESAFDKISPQTLDTIIETSGEDLRKAAVLIPFLESTELKIEELKDFLIKNEGVFTAKNDGNKRTSFRKLLAYYDRLTWGWEHS